MDNIPLIDLFPNMRVRKRQMPEKKIPNLEVPSAKSQESHEITRSKLRESLTAALRISGDIELDPNLIGGIKDENKFRVEEIGQKACATRADLNEDASADFVKTSHLDESPCKRIRLEGLNRTEEDNEAWHLMQHAEKVAADIESELFRLFGIVNRKYKEKARSLLFNLKDRTNPELRARVLSGEVSPESLCAMSAEQLASKELCQWRMAKAEELADMIVLTDAVTDSQRVMKKTHKGVYDVQVEKGGDVTEVVPVGVKQSSIFELKKGAQQNGGSTQEEAQFDHVEVDVLKGETECLEFSPIRGSISPRNFSAGLFGNKLDDLAKSNVSDRPEDTVLPAIMSPDEYFDSRKVDRRDVFDTTEQEEVTTDMNVAEMKGVVSSEMRFSNSLDSFRNNESMKLTLTQSLKGVKTGTRKMGDMRQIEKKSYSKKDDKLWEGSFQLSGFQISPILAFLRSGERVELQSWPKIVEVKGRVRLDALDKFLQELHLSRTRSVMIISCKIRLEENAISVSAMKEAANQYEKGERVGFAEPAPGFELYLFPTRGSALKLLFEHGYFDNARYETDEQELLVGCIVWRRTQIPANITHKASSHYYSVNRHALSGQMDSPTRPDEAQRLEHDVPPGFGPREADVFKPDTNISAIQDDDDDLPEFDFALENTDLHSLKVSTTNAPSSSGQGLSLHLQMPPHPQVLSLQHGPMTFSPPEGSLEHVNSLSNPHFSFMRPQILPHATMLQEHAKSVPYMLASPPNLQLLPQWPRYPGMVYPAQSFTFSQRPHLPVDGPFHASAPGPLLPLPNLSHVNQQDHVIPNFKFHTQGQHGPIEDYPRSQVLHGPLGDHLRPHRQNSSFVEYLRPQGQHGFFEDHPRPQGQHGFFVDHPRPQSQHGTFRNHPRAQGSFGDHPRQGQQGTLGDQPRTVDNFPSVLHEQIHGRPLSQPKAGVPSTSIFLPQDANWSSEISRNNIWDDDDMPEWHPPPCMQGESLGSSSMLVLPPNSLDAGQTWLSKQAPQAIIPVRPWGSMESGQQVMPLQSAPDTVRPGVQLERSVQASGFGSVPHS